MPLMPPPPAPTTAPQQAAQAVPPFDMPQAPASVSAPPGPPTPPAAVSAPPPEAPPTYQPPAPAPQAPQAAPAAQAPQGSSVPPPAPPAPVAPASEPSTAMAPAPQGGAMTQPSGNTLASTLSDLGIGGLEFDGFGVFPVISLNQGAFKTSDGSVNLGTEFRFYWKSSRAKNLIKTALSDKDERSDFTYSYDMVVDHKNQKVSDVIDRWAKAGIGYEVKKYTEVSALLEDGSMVLLSIPATSIRSISGLLANILANGENPTDVLLRAFVGTLVTESVKPFNRWGLERAR